jgi:hypothetical protein
MARRVSGGVQPVAPDVRIASFSPAIAEQAHADWTVTCYPVFGIRYTLAGANPSIFELSRVTSAASRPLGVAVMLSKLCRALARSKAAGR